MVGFRLSRVCAGGGAQPKATKSAAVDADRCEYEPRLGCFGERCLGMAEFVVEYAVLRWTVAGAFVVAAGVVIVGLLIPFHCYPELPVGSALATGPASRGISSAGASAETLAAPTAPAVALDHESDAAHLIMCAVMLVMLVFPVQANGHALHGVLTAMAVVFGALLADRLLRWYAAGRTRSLGPMIVLAYHCAAASAMLYAMTGHGATGDTPGPASGVLHGLAVLFTVDAAVVLVAARWASTGRLSRLLFHSGGAPNTCHMPWPLVPHLVMDLGTAYMLIAAAR